LSNLIIACKTITNELNLALKETGCDYPVLWVDSGLHTYPDLLRAKIQEEIDHISNVDNIILAFGLCGNSLIGLTASNARIIFPNVDDCITLMLGSCQRRKEISAQSGTYFLTKGWLDYELNIWVEYQDAVNKYGKPRADRIFKTMLKHYERLGIVSTGAYELEEFLERTQVIAEGLSLRHEVIPGTLRYIKKLLTGPWDEEFVIVNPGEKVTLDHIRN
jgi:hypothetical protein